jgi:hypothetical protein
MSVHVGLSGRCSDAASDHSYGDRQGISQRCTGDGWSAAPTRPGFDRGGKGSNPARRDRLDPTPDRRQQSRGLPTCLGAKSILAWGFLPYTVRRLSLPGGYRTRCTWGSLWGAEGSATICPWPRP